MFDVAGGVDVTVAVDVAIFEDVIKFDFGIIDRGQSLEALNRGQNAGVGVFAVKNLDEIHRFADVNVDCYPACQCISDYVAVDVGHGICTVAIKSGCGDNPGDDLIGLVDFGVLVHLNQHVVENPRGIAATKAVIADVEVIGVGGGYVNEMLRQRGER